MGGLSHVPHDDRIAALVLSLLLVLLLAQIAFSLWHGSAWGGRGGGSFRIERARHPFIYWTVMLLYSLAAAGICFVEMLLLGPR